jgi:hypothetical protein
MIRRQSERPAKILQYFPLIPWLQQLFRSPVSTDMMNWTATNKSTNGKMRHIEDSPHWKWIDEQWLEFCIIINKLMPITILILNYNLPPWQTIKKFFIIMVFLVPRPESDLDKNIDVYLALVQEEFKQL